MCNRYRPSRPERIADVFGVDPPPATYVLGGIGPWNQGPFVRGIPGGGREVVVGQWALIAPFAKARKPTGGERYMTNNARIESVATKPTFKLAWSRGQRCLIPADAFDEPNWESGRNVWWRFRRADGQPWALAGIWGEWTDPQSGEIVPSYTMLTMNADAHPLMNRMHKPDANLPPDQQDKRSAIPIEVGDWDAWLRGTVDETKGLIRLPDPSLFLHGPADTESTWAT